MRLSVMCAGMALVFGLTACGGGAGAPAPGPGASAADATAPVITAVTGITDGDTLHGSVPLHIAAQDNVAVAQIRLQLDDTELGRASGSGLSFNFPSALFPNADYKLRISALDAAGNESYPVELRLTFANGDAAPLAWPALSEVHITPPTPASPGATPAGEAPGLPDPFDRSNPPDPTDVTPPSQVLVLGMTQQQVVWDHVAFDVIAFDEKQVYAIEAAWNGQLIAAQLGQQLHVDWDSNAAADGPQELLIRAFDAGGNSAQSSLIVRVANATDNIEPRFNTRLLKPVYRAVKGNLHFQVPVIEDQAVAQLRLEVDGHEVYRSTGPDLDYTLDTTQYLDGQYRLNFFALDTAGKSSRLTVALEIANHPASRLTGTLRAPNGVDPVQGIMLQVWDRLPQGGDNYGFYNLPHGTYFQPDYDTATTGPDGRFTLLCPPGPHHLTFSTPSDGGRSWSGSLDLDVAGDTELAANLTTLAPGDGPKLGVVTGDSEDLPDLLAKIGYGQTDSTGRLVLGTEQFVLIDGNDTLPDGDYLNLPQLFAPGGPAAALDQLYICGGVHYDDWLVNTGSAQLQAWLSAGDGRRLLYCGGSAYDFFEQLLPQVVDFAGSDDFDGLLMTPERLHAAELGPALAAPRLAVAASLAGWLSAVGIQLDANGQLTGPPLAAGWVDYIALSHDYQPWAGDPALLATGQTPHALQLIYHGDLVHYNRLELNLLPVPAAPSAGWTLQERLLERQLFNGMGG